MEVMPCTYRYLRNMVVPLAVTPVMVIIYLGVSYFHPANNQWLTDGSFGWSNFLRFLFIDQLMIEFFTYLVLAWLIIAYANIFRLATLQLTPRSVAFYQLRFLPLFLLAFFFINPVTQSLRYGLHLYMGYRVDYFDSYFYSAPLYLSYLLPIMLGGYIMLNISFYQDYKTFQINKRVNQIKLNRLEVADDNGKTFIDLNRIITIERNERVNFVFTEKGRFRVSSSLADLESVLDEQQFMRINRSAIVNSAYFKNYSFWENDKYILRLTDGKEYIVSRRRLKMMKERGIILR